MTVRKGASAYDRLPMPQENVIFALAMYAGAGGLPLSKVRDYSGVRGRALAGALSGLRRRGLAWRGARGHWYPTDEGRERGQA